MSALTAPLAGAAPLPIAAGRVAASLALLAAGAALRSSGVLDSADVKVS